MTSYPLYRLPFASLILVEPTMMTRATLKRYFKDEAAMKRAMAMAAAKKDTWPSRAAAREWFARRSPWKMWDARALDAYVVRAFSSFYLCARGWTGADCGAGGW